MAREGWAPKKRKGESQTAFRRRYYTAQRNHAMETGDQATTNKIYRKLGKSAPNVDADAVNKGILSGVATTMLARVPAGAFARGGAAAAESAGARTGTALAERGAARSASNVGSAVAKRAATKAGPRVTAKVVRKALPAASVSGAVATGSRAMAKTPSAKPKTKNSTAKKKGSS